MGRMKKSNVGQWLDRKYLAWQVAQGESRSIAEFARHLGVSRGTFNKWSSGERSPDAYSVELLARGCQDDEIYDLVGLKRPDPLLRRMTDLFSQLSEKKKLEYLRRLEGEEPEQVRKANESKTAR